MKFFPDKTIIRKSIIIPIIALSFLFAPSANAFFADVFAMAQKFSQYYAFWQQIRSELDRMSSSVNEEVLHANKTIDPEGEPAYVEYYRDFIGESQFRGENVFRVQLNGTPFCDYLKESLQSIYGVGEFELDGRKGLPAGYDTKAADVRVHPFELSSRCTLATIEGANENEGAGVRNNQDRFLDDWIQSSDPLGSYKEVSRTQNNFFGAWLLSDREFKKQSEFEKDKDILELLTNQGYTGVKDTGDTDEPGCRKDTQGRCVALGKVATPGDILAEVSAKIYTAEWDLVTNRQEGKWGSVLNSLIEKFLNFNTSTGVEGEKDDLASIGIINLSEEPGSGFNPDYRNARNYQACVRACDEEFKPRKEKGCNVTPAQCTICTVRAGESITGGFECVAWATSTCEGEPPPSSKCDIEDINYGERAKCKETCSTRWLFDIPGKDEISSFCPAGTVPLGAKARNGAEYVDDSNLAWHDFTGGKIALVCGRGLAETNGRVYVGPPPPRQCPDGTEIPASGDYKTLRATNISKFCFGDSQAAFPLEFLNPTFTIDCSQHEDGYSEEFTLPEGAWFFGAIGPGTATAEVCLAP